MRSAVKRLVMWGYCHGWVAAGVVEAMFRLFGLKGA